MEFMAFAGAHLVLKYFRLFMHVKRRAINGRFIQWFLIILINVGSSLVVIILM
jgi:hypothetical protein